MSCVPRAHRTWPAIPVSSPDRSQRAARLSGSCLYKPPVTDSVGPVAEAFGPEFKAGKQAVDVRHSERLLEELGVRWPQVVQGSQEERRDAPLIPLPLGEVR
jgi:hypothetical protein